jgi:two-component system chemotaxis response regulator CheB
MAVKKTKVLIVDDSALIRGLLTKIINEQPDMAAVGAAPDPLVARQMVRDLAPDVMTLDIEMPRMDGLDFLEKIMRLRPMPVVMVSSLTESGAQATLRALEIGAVDFVPKPKLDISRGLLEYANVLTDKIRAAAKARMPVRSAGSETVSARPPTPLSGYTSTEKLILIGASTGGTEAIREVLTAMPADCPGILITQHMPAGFTRSFAERLDRLCKIRVKEAEHGERVLPGHAYIAPGNRHLLLEKSGANYMTALSDEPAVNRHRPSVEVLFRSGARHAGKSVVGAMLTGMGKDGAQAMLEMREAGAYNIAQNEATCVVFGMPREAILAGAVHEVLPLAAIAAGLLAHCTTKGGRAIRV